MSRQSLEANITGILPESASQQAAGLIRYCMALLGMDRASFAKWLRRIADDLDAIEETRQ